MQGAAGFDPVRWHLIETLARRAQACSGATRKVVDAKLERLAAALRDDLAQVRPAAVPPPIGTSTPVAAKPDRADGADGADVAGAAGAAEHQHPLADLLAHIDRASAAVIGAPVPTASAPASPAIGINANSASHSLTGMPELKAIQLFSSTWAQLGASRRLTQAQAHVPDNAGPLNSQRLLHRALTLMRALSPAYLDHFIAHADALLWLEQAVGGPLPTAKGVAGGGKGAAPEPVAAARKRAPRHAKK